MVRLADLRGAALRRVGLTADFIACRNYWLTQPWGVAIHDHPQAVDGIVYVSRQVPNLQAVALFERAAGKIALSAPGELGQHSGLAAAASALNLRARF